MAVRNYQCRYKIYTKKEIDEIIDNLDIDLTDYYTKSEVDNLIPDMTDYYDKTDIDGMMDDKQDVLTAGTGITIDSDNVISASGGSGGTWTKRTPNNDWSDLFEVDGTTVKPKKDILFVDSNKCEFYAMKGINNTSGYFEIVFSAFGMNTATQDVYKIYSLSHIMVTSGNIDNTASSFNNYYDTIEFTINQGSITNVTTGSYFGNGYAKSSLTIYVKE